MHDALPKIEEALMGASTAATNLRDASLEAVRRLVLLQEAVADSLQFVTGGTEMRLRTALLETLKPWPWLADTPSITLGSLEAPSTVQGFPNSDPNSKENPHA